MTTAIDTVLNISANISGQQAVEAMRTGIGGIATAYDRVKLSSGALVTGLRGLAAAAGGAVFGEIIKSTIEYGDQLELMSQKTGIGATELAKWIEAAQMAGKGADTVETGFKRLSKTMLEAVSGNEKASTSFKALGLNISDLKNKSPNEIMLEISDAFAKMPDGIVKAGLAMQLFGKSGTDMIPVLNEGREGIEGLTVAATQGFAEKSHIFTDNMVLMKQSVLNLKVEVTDGLLPSLIDMQNSWLDVTKGEDGITQFFEMIGTAVRGVMFAIQGLVNTLGAIKDVEAYIITPLVDKLMGKDYGTSVDIAAGQLEKSFSDRLQNVTTKNADLFRHDAFFGNPSAPYKKPKVLDSNAEGNALDALQKQSPQDKKFATDMAKLAATGQEQIQALKDETQQVGLTAAAIANLKDQRETTKDIQEKSIGLSSSQAAAYAKEATSLLQIREALRLQNEEQQRTFSFGVQQWAAKYQQDVGNAAKNASDMMQKSFDDMTQGLTNFVTGAKSSWASMIQSFMNDLIKMQIQSQVMGPLAKIFSGGVGSLFSEYSSPIGPTLSGDAQGGVGFLGSILSSFAGGGIMTPGGPVPLKRYASGGVANTPQMSIFGEGNGAEAYVPLPDGRTIPVALSGGGMGDTAVNVHMHMDGSSGKMDANGPNSDSGQKLGYLVAGVVKSVLVNEKRPGGMLSASPSGGA